jgi:hypothetical protein
MATRTRAPRGGGALYQRTKGHGAGKWYKEIPVGVDPLTGKAKVKSFSGKTQTKAARRARDWQREQGGAVTTGAEMTVMTAVQQIQGRTMSETLSPPPPPPYNALSFTTGPRFAAYLARCKSAASDHEHIIEALGAGAVILVGVSFLRRRRQLSPAPSTA